MSNVSQQSETRGRERSTALFLTAIVCLVCSLAVSVAAVTLGPVHHENALLFQRQQLLIAAGWVGEGESLTSEDLQERFESGLAERWINPKTGAPTSTKDGALAVYEILEGERRVGVVLPVEGPGLWSTLRGYLAIEADGNTVRDLVFYEHAETPGLGGEIESPRWRMLWRGVRLFDELGKLRINVSKGKETPRLEEGRGATGAAEPTAASEDVYPVDATAGATGAAEPTAASEGVYHVDVIAGATITSHGVGKLVRHWLGPDAYGPYLARLRAQGDARGR